MASPSASSKNKVAGNCLHSRNGVGLSPLDEECLLQSSWSWAEQLCELDSLFAPSPSSWATQTTSGYEKFACLVFQKAHCLAYMQDTCRVLGGSTCQFNGFFVWAYFPWALRMWFSIWLSCFRAEVSRTHLDKICFPYRPTIYLFIAYDIVLGS